MSTLKSQLKQYIEERLQRDLYRQRHLNLIPDGAINFHCNDYLSLSSEPRIKKAYQQGLILHPVGSGGSMVVSGYGSVHQKLEQAFAEALKVDDCLLFSSGYAANLAVMNLLAHFNALILIDKRIHASVYDGLKLSGAQYTRYKHNNLVDIALKIEGASANPVLVTEGIFSMSGQCAPLTDIARLSLLSLKGSHPHLQAMIVDEAHSFGILGHQGLGAVNFHRLTQTDVPLRIIPLGKAYAAAGAIVAGDGVWIDALIQVARSYIYSTAMSPALAYGLLETLNIVRDADDRRKKLNDLVSYFRTKVQQSTLKWANSSSQIQQLQLGCPQRALFWAKKLREKSIFCTPMRQPTLSKEETGLRIILNYQHEPEQIDYLFQCIHELC